MTPSYFVIFLEKDLLWIYPGLEVILAYFGFTEFGVLELSRTVFSKFGVIELFWIRQKFIFFLIGAAWICRACWSCFKTQIEFSVPIYVFLFFYCGYRAFSVLVDPVSFPFLFYSDSFSPDSCCEGIGVGCFLLSIQEIYIDVVPDVVIRKVNWLHYLNYEVVPRTSSTCH